MTAIQCIVGCRRDFLTHFDDGLILFVFLSLRLDDRGCYEVVPTKNTGRHACTAVPAMKIDRATSIRKRQKTKSLGEKNRKRFLIVSLLSKNEKALINRIAKSTE